MSQRKRWDEHSARWQREHAAAGETAERWDAWTRLSVKTRRETDPRAYARGETVSEQRTARAREIATEQIARAQPFSRPATVREAVKGMSSDELRWTSKASTEQIRKRARNPRYIRTYKDGSQKNPWWYH